MNGKQIFPFVLVTLTALAARPAAAEDLAAAEALFDKGVADMEAGRYEIQDHCDGAVCDVEGKGASDAAKLPAMLSTIGFGVGAAGVAAGLVLWLTEPSPPAVGRGSSRVRAMVDAGPAGAAVGVKGVW